MMLLQRRADQALQLSSFSSPFTTRHCEKKKYLLTSAFLFLEGKGHVCVCDSCLCAAESREGGKCLGEPWATRPAGTLILGALTQPEMPASRSGCALPQAHLFWHSISLICSFHFAHSSLGVAPWSGTIAQHYPATSAFTYSYHSCRCYS